MPSVLLAVSAALVTGWPAGGRLHHVAAAGVRLPWLAGAGLTLQAASGLGRADWHLVQPDDARPEAP